MKKLNQIRILFGMFVVFALMTYMTSCSKVEVEELPNSVVEASQVLVLPEVAYHLQENTTEEALPMHEAYQNLDNIETTDAAKRDAELILLLDSINTDPCSYFDFYGCHANYSCSYCVYLAQHCYWTQYFYWFHNPTSENCTAMAEAYCNYLITHRNCYGGDPITTEDCYGDSPCN